MSYFKGHRKLKKGKRGLYSEFWPKLCYNVSQKREIGKKGEERRGEESGERMRERERNMNYV